MPYKKRRTEQTGHALAEAFEAEAVRHEDAKADIWSAAGERQAVVNARLAQLEAESQVLRSVVGAI